jgi:hypothetical protein
LADFAAARRLARGSTLVLSLFCYSIPTDASAADAEESADACVGFRNETGDKQLTVHARNSCERTLSCKLEYTVLCEDEHQAVTSRAEKRTAFQLGKQGSQDLSLSAAACKQGWRIEDLRWTCS